MGEKSKAVTYELIKAAIVEENAEAIRLIVSHYRGYIRRVSTCVEYDEYGNPHSCINDDMAKRIEIKLIARILNFSLEDATEEVHKRKSHKKMTM